MEILIILCVVVLVVAYRMVRPRSPMTAGVITLILGSGPIQKRPITWIVGVVIVLLGAYFGYILITELDGIDEIEPGSLTWVLPWLLIPVVMVMAYYTSHEPTGPCGNTGYKDKENALRVGLITTLAVLLWQGEEFFETLVSGLGLGMSQHVAGTQWLSDVLPFVGFVLLIAAFVIGFWMGKYKQGAILTVFLLLGNIILHA